MRVGVARHLVASLGVDLPDRRDDGAASVPSVGLRQARRRLEELQAERAALG